MRFAPLFFVAFFVSCSMSHAAGFAISSTDLKARQMLSNKEVFNGFGCNGKNISPQISWSNAPAETKSFALTVYDPDAPTGSGWWHWLVVNIPATYNKIPSNFGGENKFVLGNGATQARNDFGTFSFGGACPPKGDKPHRYIFTIYALKTDKINLEENSTAALAGFFIHQNILAKASFETYFGR